MLKAREKPKRKHTRTIDPNFHMRSNSRKFSAYTKRIHRTVFTR